MKPAFFVREVGMATTVIFEQTLPRDDGQYFSPNVDAGTPPPFDTTTAYWRVYPHVVAPACRLVGLSGGLWRYETSYTQWQSIDIPKNAKIISATVDVSISVNSTTQIPHIYAYWDFDYAAHPEATGVQFIFSDYIHHMSSVYKIWDLLGTGVQQLDITSLLQAVVDDPNWIPGSPMGLIWVPIVAEGSVTIRPADRPGGVPKNLTVTYDDAGPGPDPVIHDGETDYTTHIVNSVLPSVPRDAESDFLIGDAFKLQAEAYTSVAVKIDYGTSTALETEGYPIRESESFFTNRVAHEAIPTVDYIYGNRTDFYVTAILESFPSRWEYADTEFNFGVGISSISAEVPSQSETDFYVQLAYEVDPDYVGPPLPSLDFAFENWNQNYLEAFDEVENFPHLQQYLRDVQMTIDDLIDATRALAEHLKRRK